MPLYDYRCSACGKIIEVRHGFNDAHAEACPECGGALKRVFNAAPIVFKGSGFYVTDSRKRSPGGDSNEPAKADAPPGKTDATAPAPKSDAPGPASDAPAASSAASPASPPARSPSDSAA
ncbi:MAG: FmdB family transcriptional regulator [Candidatus Eremiobacteraeota bacterium]|nr:FmdB family transcriptional regulator [Candidatus Eremiobacteraeota bacterium]